MHDCKGREIKQGDVLKFNPNGADRFGIAVVLHPQQQTCNVEVMTAYSYDMQPNSECYNAVKVTRKEDGSVQALTVSISPTNAHETEIVAAGDGRDLTPPA